MISASNDSRINVEVWLPINGWNGLYLGVGNLSICLIGGSCGLYGSPGSYAQIFLSSSHDGPFYLTSGELNLVTPSTPAAAPTSEPSSLLLLGTGIAGCAAMMARMASRRAASGT